jgi:hypothetical protein
MSSLVRVSSRRAETHRWRAKGARTIAYDASSVSNSSMDEKMISPRGAEVPRGERRIVAIRCERHHMTNLDRAIRMPTTRQEKRSRLRSIRRLVGKLAIQLSVVASNGLRDGNSCTPVTRGARRNSALQLWMFLYCLFDAE